MADYASLIRRANPSYGLDLSKTVLNLNDDLLLQ